MALLFESYSRWGVREVVLFDRPNRRRTWIERDWAQTELVERFIDIFLPAAQTALEAGLTPVFPPLEPGGDYWDTAFLRSALQAVQRRGSQQLIRQLALSAYAWPDNLPLNWGAGGPERWPAARPYGAATGEEDQRGFHIFDWYLAIGEAVLGFRPRIHLLGTGSQIGAQREPSLPPVDETAHTDRNIELLHLLIGGGDSDQDADELDPIPVEVESASFWLLAADETSPHLDQAWFKPGGQTLPVVGALKQLFAEGVGNTPAGKGALRPGHPLGAKRPIAHYLLLPSYEWGIADWHLEAVRSFVKHHRPTVGFSLVEASQSTFVSVMGGLQDFPEEILEELRSAGCTVERINGDGITIAPIRAEV
jgi:hypothetical protein